jgi:uncharacterized membrane protein YfcA
MSETAGLAIVAFLAGFVNGFTGFGAMLVALPLMVLFIDIKTAIPLITMLGITINFVLVFQLAKHFEVKKWLPLFIAALPGIPVGIYILKTMDPRFLEVLIGAVVIMTATATRQLKSPVTELKKFWAYAAGFAAGLLGGSIGAPGPPVVIYTSLQPWTKQQVKATMVALFTLGGPGILFLQFFYGFITKDVLLNFSFCILPLVFGVLTGVFLFERIKDAIYRRFVYVLLLALGILMMAKGCFPGLLSQINLSIGTQCPFVQATLSDSIPLFCFWM